MTLTAVKDTRSHRTRDSLIRAAERLFAEQGVDGVSINTITRAAGQANRNAVQYHFGNKNGLLQAIFDKHGPALAERRAELADQMLADGVATPQLVATAIVQPLIEKLDDSDGGEAYIHISAELIATNTLGYDLADKHSLQLARETKIAKLAAQELTELPPEIAQQRILLMNVLGFHGVSDHARVRKNTGFNPLIRDTDFMASNLIDSMAAILEAPPSQHSLDILAKRRETTQHGDPSCA